MAISTNRAPYFDDTDKRKNYLKVLFAAGRPVQARELNSLQTIIANQTGIFADHIFQNGSRVSNGAVSIIEYEYVRLQDNRENGEAVKLAQTDGLVKLVGESSNVEATLIHKVDKVNNDPNTLYVIYTKTGKDAERIRFLPGEKIFFCDDAGNKLYDANVKCPTCPGSPDTQDQIEPVAPGAKFLNVADGIFYYNGYFVDVQSSKIVFSKYGEAANCKIGFDVVESIVTAEDDPTLYDNALGYPNETAPGADRFSMNLVLTKRTLDDADGTNFIQLAVVENGYVQTIKSDVEYSGIMDTMAKRTFEESGNYTVVAWKPTYREHKKETPTDPNGFIYGTDANESLVNCLISAGIGYVKGYRTETSHESFINVPKARTTAAINNGSVFFDEGCYVDLIPDETLSVWPNNPTAASIVNLQDIQLYDGEPNNHAPSGKVIGSIRVADAVFIGTKNEKKVWRYKVIDSRLNESANNVKCVSSETSRFLATPVDGKFTLINQAEKTMFWKLPKTNVKSLRDNDNSDRGSITISMRKKLNATLDAGGQYQFTLSSATFDPSIKDTIIVVGESGDYTSIYATAENCKPAGNSLAVNLGTDNSGKKVTVIHTVTNIDLIEKQKQSQTHIIRNITRVDSNNFQNRIMLKRADVYMVESVSAYSSQSPATTEDVTAKFELDNGVTPYSYGESSIMLKQGEAVSSSFDTIDIKIRYFSHSDPNQAGYFTIDSYSNVLADADSKVDYKSLPVYADASGNTYTADQIIDFRTVAVGDITGEVPATRTTAIFDIAYYVGRIDLLCVDSTGKFFHLMGQPSDDPKAPVNNQDDIMPLYRVLIPAYTYSAKDIKCTLIENKRYTMRDIGRLEKRIENLEYYTTLSLLESQAASAQVKDANGLDRYKNGFVVDDFSKYSTGDTTSNEFRAILDTEKRQLRPRSILNNRKAEFKLKDSTNAIVRNGIAMIGFQHEKVDEQPYGSRPLSINPYLIYRKAGTMVLTPNVDSWADTERQPDMQMTIDTGVDAVRQLAARTDSIATAFNNHVFANSTILDNGTIDTGVGTLTRKTDVQTRVTTNSTSWGNSIVGGQRTTTITDTTTTQTDTRTERKASVSSQSNSYTFDRVTDVSIIPYMRETNIEFVASGLAPNTRFYVFFDDQDVTSLTSIQGNSNDIQTMQQASMLLSDARGSLAGSVRIPAGRFFTGTRVLRVTNDKSNSKSETLETSYAEAQFFAGGIKQQKQNINMNVVTPVYSERDVSSTSSTTTQTRNIQTRSRSWDYTPPPPPPPRNRDPIAQSFKLDFDCFVSKLNLYFENVVEADEIWFEIRTMDNGYPTETVLGRVVKKGKSIKTSPDASVATEIEFVVPVRISANTEYCFVIGGDSPETRVWIAKLGEKSVNVPDKVCDTQITLGSSFRSQNGSTWNAEQYEDIMYKLFVAKFGKNSMNLAFDVSGGHDTVPLAKTPFEGEKGSNLVRVYTKNPHGLVAGDKVMLSLYPSNEYIVDLVNGSLVVGHEILIDGKSKAVVTSVEYITPSQCSVRLSAFEGNVSVGSTFIATPFVKKSAAADAMKAFYDADIAEFDVRQAAGRFTKVGNATALNGFDVSLLNGSHQVKRVDDIGTFVIEMSQQAEMTGRFGPAGASAMVNIKADIVNFAGAYLTHEATEEWIMKAYAHGEQGSLFERQNYRALDPMTIIPKTDRYMEQPIKIATVVNEKEQLGGKASVSIVGKFESANPYLSPMVNIDTFSMTLIGNDVCQQSPDAMNASPNGSGRFVEETNKSQGSERFKYVTKQINLANSAADLRIWFDMFKPATSDFDLYVKLAKPEVQNIDDQDWVLVTDYDKSPTSTNVNDFVEFDLLLSNIMPSITGLDNLFGSFKFKIVARSKNSSVPPVFRNLRLIAHT